MWVGVFFRVFYIEYQKEQKFRVLALLVGSVVTGTIVGILMLVFEIIIYRSSNCLGLSGRSQLEFGKKPIFRRKCHRRRKGFVSKGA